MRRWVTVNADLEKRESKRQNCTPNKGANMEKSHPVETRVAIAVVAPHPNDDDPRLDSERSKRLGHRKRLHVLRAIEVVDK